MKKRPLSINGFLSLFEAKNGFILRGPFFSIEIGLKRLEKDLIGFKCLRPTY
jgi:hypothetical protein